MFLHLSVSHSVHRGGGGCLGPGPGGGFGIWLERGVQAQTRGVGGGLAEGVQAQAQAQAQRGVEAHTQGGVQVHTWGGPGPGGVSQHALRQTPLQQTATAAGGTHPNVIHSC